MDSSTEKQRTNSQSAPCDYLESEEEPQKPLKFSHDYVILILREHLSAGKDGMTQKEITDEFAEMMSKSDGCEYTYDDKQSTVSKALKRLIERKTIAKFKKTYRLVDTKNAKEITKEQILQEVRFEDKSVFRISKSTVVIHPTASTIHKAKLYLSNYIGTAKCFGILEVDGYLVVMLKGSGEKLDALRADIVNLINEAYQKQNKKK